MSIVDYPLVFIGGVALLVFASGLLGMAVVYNVPFVWNDDTRYAFPVAQLVIRTFSIFGSMHQLLLLMWGIGTTILFHTAQALQWVIPHTVIFLKQRVINSWFCLPQVLLNMNTAPMLWAIGFIAGNILVVPLIVGMLLKIVLMDPCYRLAFATTLSESELYYSFLRWDYYSRELCIVFGH